MKKDQEEVENISPFKGVPSHLLADDREIIILKKEKAEYTLEELKEIHKNLPPMTEEEIKNTFIEDDEPIDFSKLKI